MCVCVCVDFLVAALLRHYCCLVDRFRGRLSFSALTYFFLVGGTDSFNWQLHSTWMLRFELCGQARKFFLLFFSPPRSRSSSKKRERKGRIRAKDSISLSITLAVSKNSMTASLTAHSSLSYIVDVNLDGDSSYSSIATSESCHGRFQQPTITIELQ